MHRMDTDKAYWEKAWRQLRKNATNCIEQILEVTSHKTVPTTDHPSKLDEQDMQGTAGEVGLNS